MQSIFTANRTALVTGASAGIGLELTRALAPKLDSLIVVARRIGRLEEVAKELKSRYPKLNSDPEAVQGLLQKLETRRVNVDVLVNNAVWVSRTCSKGRVGTEFVRSSRSILLRCCESRTICYPG